MFQTGRASANGKLIGLNHHETSERIPLPLRV